MSQNTFNLKNSSLSFLSGSFFQATKLELFVKCVKPWWHNINRAIFLSCGNLPSEPRQQSPLPLLHWRSSQTRTGWMHFHQKKTDAGAKKLTPARHRKIAGPRVRTTSVTVGTSPVICSLQILTGMVFFPLKRPQLLLARLWNNLSEPVEMRTRS